MFPQLQILMKVAKESGPDGLYQGNSHWVQERFNQERKSAATTQLVVGPSEGEKKLYLNQDNFFSSPSRRVLFPFTVALSVGIRISNSSYTASPTLLSPSM